MPNDYKSEFDLVVSGMLNLYKTFGCVKCNINVWLS